MVFLFMSMCVCVEKVCMHHKSRISTNDRTNNDDRHKKTDHRNTHTHTQTSLSDVMPCHRCISCETENMLIHAFIFLLWRNRSNVLSLTLSLSSVLSVTPFYSFSKNPSHLNHNRSPYLPRHTDFCNAWSVMENDISRPIKHAKMSIEFKRSSIWLTHVFSFFALYNAIALASLYWFLQFFFKSF